METLKVFISWGGDRSKRIAEILHKWIPAVLQAAKPYFSPDDVDKGARWSNEIGRELEESSIGLLCVTPENRDAPWIMFEAGALSKKVDSARVCPILLAGLKPTDMKGPLTLFQAAPFEKTEIGRVVRMMNEALGPNGLAPDVLTIVFEKWWPDLERDVTAALAAPAPAAPARTERDLLEEVLSLVRNRPTTTSDRISRHEVPLLYRMRRHYSVERGGNMEAQITVGRPPHSGEILQYASHLGYMVIARWESDSLLEAMAQADKDAENAGGKPGVGWYLGPVRPPG